MGHFSAPGERQRKLEMTPEKIMRIAHRMGMFTVTLRWRDDWLRSRCAELKRQGLLTGGKRNGKQLQFFPTPIGASTKGRP